MYAPWIGADRPKRKSVQCRVISKIQSGKRDENKRKSWREEMKEKQMKDNVERQQYENKDGEKPNEKNVDQTREGET